MLPEERKTTEYNYFWGHPGGKKKVFGDVPEAVN